MNKMNKMLSRSEIQNFLSDYEMLKANNIKFIYIHGPIGSGKTYLMNSMCENFQNNINVSKIKFISIKRFMDEFLNSIKRNSLSDFLDNYINDIEVLIIDDIEELQNKEGTQEQLLHIFNELYLNNRLIVVTSCIPPNKLSGFNKKLIDRLNGGLTIPLRPPSKNERKIIIKNICIQYDVNMNNSVLDTIASKKIESIRTLESIIIKAKMLSHLESRDISSNLELFVYEEGLNEKN